MLCSTHHYVWNISAKQTSQTTKKPEPDQASRIKYQFRRNTGTCKIIKHIYNQQNPEYSNSVRKVFLEQINCKKRERKIKKHYTLSH